MKTDPEEVQQVIEGSGVLPARGTKRVPRVKPALSIVAPVYDESANLAPLHERVREGLRGGPDWELVLVDDGSRDDSWQAMRTLAQTDDRVRLVRMRQNCGQSAAIFAGLHATRADVVATIDADLQNDPADLIEMFERLDGYDAIVGYRVKREDTWVRRASSKVANAVRNFISKDNIRDTGCSLKVFRREAVLTLTPFNGIHRFLPTLLRYRGYRVAEHPVSHGPRLHGQSKYGIRNRAFRAFCDLLAVRWMRSRMLHLPDLVELDPETTEGDRRA